MNYTSLICFLFPLFAIGQEHKIYYHLEEALQNPEQVYELSLTAEMFGDTTNVIKALPERIGAFINLRRLAIYSDELSELPNSIGKLKNLEVFELSASKLSKLPESIGQLFSLKELFFVGTNVKTLPKSMANLKHLKWLYYPEEVSR
ncbi:MAG: leucine-rich repeat protein SHOC2, partial [Aureispira sp.]